MVLEASILCAVSAVSSSTMFDWAKLFNSCFFSFVAAACEGTLSCSTCHLIVDKEWYSKIPDLLTEEEEDMLDLAFGLTDT